MIFAVEAVPYLVIVLILRCFEVKAKQEEFVPVNNMQDGLGNYNFSYQEQNQNRTEIGEVLKSQSDKPALEVHGSYANIFKLGKCQKITVTYVADENGYRARVSYKPDVAYSTKHKMNILKCQVPKMGVIGMAPDKPNKPIDIIPPAAISSLAGGGSLG